MKAVGFAYWLQGFFELDTKESWKTDGINPQQADLIRRHLALVFKHEIDPSYSDNPAVQQQLNETHHGPVTIQPIHPPQHPFGGSNLNVRC